MWRNARNGREPVEEEEEGALTDQQKASLIVFVQHEPPLWDAQDPNNKNQLYRTKGWMKVMELFSRMYPESKIGMEKLKSSWKILRAQFLRATKWEVQQQKMHDDPYSDARKCTWKFYDTLMFLNGTSAERDYDNCESPSTSVVSSESSRRVLKRQGYSDDYGDFDDLFVTPKTESEEGCEGEDVGELMGHQNRETSPITQTIKTIINDSIRRRTPPSTNVQTNQKGKKQRMQETEDYAVLPDQYSASCSSAEEPPLTVTRPSPRILLDEIQKKRFEIAYKTLQMALDELATKDPVQGRYFLKEIRALTQRIEDVSDAIQ